MSDGRPNGEGEPMAMVGDEPLSQYFAPAKMGFRVTRQELVQVLGLYAQKIDVHEAMKVLDFGLRRAIRETIREEREAVEKEDHSPIIKL
jgi:hypothetical protein